MLDEVADQTGEETHRDGDAEDEADPRGDRGPAQGRGLHAGARLARTRSPIGWIAVIVRPTSSARRLAQSIPTVAHRNHGPTVFFDSSRTHRCSTPLATLSN